MKKGVHVKFGLRMKFMALFLMFGAVILAAAFWFISRMIREIYKEHYNEVLSDIAETSAENMGLGAEEIPDYVQSGIVDERYQQALARLEKIRDRFEMESIYIIYPTGEDENRIRTAVWFADASKDGARSLGDPVENYHVEESRRVREAYETGKASEEMDWTRIVTEGEDGEGQVTEYVISAYYPIIDGQGNRVAVLGVDKAEREMEVKVRSSLMQAAGMISLIVTVSVALLITFVQFDIVHAIRRLKNGVKKLGEGEHHVQIQGGRRDELGDIANAFNRMADSIGRHMGEMEELNAAYRKLLPSGIFELLHKKSIVDFKLGDQANADLTVLAIEPSGAGMILPGLDSGQTFGYINEMLAQMVPAILEHGGAAWNFDRAAMYSFFQHSERDALDAALLAGRNLNKKGERAVAGIMRGSVMVGVAGHETRMNVIAISEQTRIAAFFMRIGSRYHASVLIGRSAASHIPGFENRYHVRFLGYLKISVSGRLEGVYDVFDGDEDCRRAGKRRTKQDFEQGVLLFTRQNYQGARDQFIDVLRQYREDEAARVYLELCSRILAEKGGSERVWFEEL